MIASLVIACESDDTADIIITDNTLGAEMAADHLLNLGHRNICYISDHGKTIEEDGGRAVPFMTTVKKAGARPLSKVSGRDLTIPGWEATWPKRDSNPRTPSWHPASWDRMNCTTTRRVSNRTGTTVPRSSTRATSRWSKTAPGS